MPAECLLFCAECGDQMSCSKYNNLFLPLLRLIIEADSKDTEALKGPVHEPRLAGVLRCISLWKALTEVT